MGSRPIWLLCGLLAASLAAQGPGSDPQEGRKAEPDVRTICHLLEIGLDDDSVVAWLDRAGYPELLTDDDLLLIRRAGGRDKLQSRLLERVKRESETRRFASLYESFDAKLSDGNVLSLPCPKGYRRSISSRGGRRIQLDENDSPGWFRGTRYFVWIENRRDYAPENVGGIARLAIDSIRERLVREHWIMSPAEERLITDRKTGRSTALFETIANEAESAAQGVIGVTAKVDVESDCVFIVGYCAPIAVDAHPLEKARVVIGDLLGNLRLSRPR